MRVPTFFKSKRNLTIIGQALVGLAAALWPQKFLIVSEVAKAFIPGVS